VSFRTTKKKLGFPVERRAKENERGGLPLTRVSNLGGCAFLGGFCGKTGKGSMRDSKKKGAVSHKEEDYEKRVGSLSRHWRTKSFAHTSMGWGGGGGGGSWGVSV